MSKDNKNAEIKKHKGKAPGRGKTFPVEITEQVDVTDSIGLEKAKKYVNLREYIKKCKKRC